MAILGFELEGPSEKRGIAVPPNPQLGAPSAGCRTRPGGLRDAFDHIPCPRSTSGAGPCPESLSTYRRYPVDGQIRRRWGLSLDCVGESSWPVRKLTRRSRASSGPLAPVQTVRNAAERSQTTRTMTTTDAGRVRRATVDRRHHHKPARPCLVRHPSFMVFPGVRVTAGRPIDTVLV